MLSVGTRVRINENYLVRVSHGLTGTITDYDGYFYSVNMDHGNDLGPDFANLHRENELDILEDTDVHF